MTVEYKLKEGREYPYVGVYKDDSEETIVLFTDKDTGFCIQSTENFYIGDLRTRSNVSWVEDKFMPLKEITIKM